MRDTGPAFVVGDGLGSIDFNFNGWGNKQAHQFDKKVAQFVNEHLNGPSKVESPLNVRCVGIRAPIVLEGGGIEVDGFGTAILVETCILNPNRNPGMTKPQCEKILMPLLGLTKIIWLPGNAQKDPFDITDGHVDGYVRFGASPTTLLMANDVHDGTTTQSHLQILRQATNAQNQAFWIVLLDHPTQLPKAACKNPEFCASYVNFYMANGIVLIPKFGDMLADQKALTTFQNEFPNHSILPIEIDGIAAGGGGIHCVTQQQPYVGPKKPG